MDSPCTLPPPPPTRPAPPTFRHGQPLLFDRRATPESKRATFQCPVAIITYAVPHPDGDAPSRELVKTIADAYNLFQWQPAGPWAKLDKGEGFVVFFWANGTTYAMRRTSMTEPWRTTCPERITLAQVVERHGLPTHFHPLNDPPAAE